MLELEIRLSTIVQEILAVAMDQKAAARTPLLELATIINDIIVSDGGIGIGVAAEYCRRISEDSGDGAISVWVLRIRDGLNAAVDDYTARTGEWLDRAGSHVGEVFVDFDSGKISGEISGAEVYEVADALLRVSWFIRTLSPKAGYADFDEGKLFAHDDGITY